MKKFFAFAVVLLITCSALFAGNGTRIGSAHRTDYGFLLGRGGGNIAWHGGIFFDINAANSNFRTRINLGLAERPFPLDDFRFNPTAGLNLQYLLRLADALYVYPTIGALYEHYSPKTYHSFNNNFGFEAGAGMEIQFSYNFGIFVEGAYQVMLPEASRLDGRLGVVIHF